MPSERRAWLAGIVAAVALAGCAATPPAPVARPAPPVAVPPPPGLSSIIGADAAAVIARLGPLSRDAREGPARLLQFVRPACILDVYLYPGTDGALAVRTAAARRPDGTRIDPGACLTLLAPPR